jgi:hypothetical protein
MVTVTDTDTPVGGEDWEVVMAMLPEGWRDWAGESGALRRCRNFADASVLLRVLMIHLVDGCSLRETAVRASQGKLAKVSDVALMKRLKTSGEWFRRIAGGLMRQYVSQQPEALFPGLPIRLIDGSSISEPGATGSTWRLHYSVSLPALQCDEVHVTEPAVGESFKRFKVAPGDLLIGDRGYAHRAGIRHVVEQGGHVLVRLNLDNVPLETAQGERFDILARLRSLTACERGDWPVWIRDKQGRIAARLCAIRKSAQAAERAREKLRREAARQKRQIKPETLEGAGYICVFTTLPVTVLTTAVLEMYRGRWQIELAFKRLKSLLDIGHLKKTDMEGAKAWLQGKLMVAFLIDALIVAGERFSPWGYPIASVAALVPVPVARNLADAPFA